MPFPERLVGLPPFPRNRPSRERCQEHVIPLVRTWHHDLKNRPIFLKIPEIWWDQSDPILKITNF
jgi:hypothetical protein